MNGEEEVTKDNGDGWSESRKVGKKGAFAAGKGRSKNGIMEARQLCH